MKKILILILTIFLTSGCFDYIELNDLSIVTGISVDYENKEYTVAFEILNEQKEGKESSKKEAVIIKDTGKTIIEAFYNVTKKVPKKAYFAHLKCLIISEEIAKNKLENLIDYYLRNPDIRNEFNTIIAKDLSAYELLNSGNEDNPIISDTIESLLNNNKYYKNNTTSNPFEEMVTDILLFGTETKIPVIGKEEDYLDVLGIGVFNDYHLQGILSAEDSMTYNILTGDALNATYTIPCDNEFISLGIYKSEPSIEVSKNTVKIKANLEASVIDSVCNYNFKDPEVYKELNKKYAQFFEENITNFIDTTIKLDSDALGVGRTYYIKSRKKDENIFKTAKYDVDVTLNINKKGLIFEVEDDN